MRIQIQVRGLQVPAEVLAFIQRRALFALGRFGQRIRNTQIRLWDSNGSRGGVDQCCDIHINFGAGPPVIIRERQVSLQAAATIALERAERQTVRHIELAKVNRIPVTTGVLY